MKCSVLDASSNASEFFENLVWMTLAAAARCFRKTEVDALLDSSRKGV